MDTRNNDFDFDFTPIGQAIKKARTAKGMTREQLARIVDYDPRHLQAIENEGQKPSLELFIQLVTMFGVSVDEYIFPDNEVKRSSVRRRLDAELDKLNDKELSIVEATVSGLGYGDLAAFVISKNTFAFCGSFHRTDRMWYLGIKHLDFLTICTFDSCRNFLRNVGTGHYHSH